MPGRGVIQDSDDEDGGFSPVKSDHASPIYTVEGAPDAPTASASRSTDPEYFENVYAEQKHRVALGADIESLNGERAGIDFVEESSIRPNSMRDDDKGNHSSSITDPVVASRRKKISSAKDFESITQITTPGKKSSASVDPYAIPSSSPGEDDNGVRPKNTKTYSKRKKTQRLTPAHKSLQSVEQGHATGRYEYDDPSTGPAKRRKISEPNFNIRLATDDVDLVLVPRTEYANTSSAAGLPGKESSGSVVYDTMKTESEGAVEPSGASFYIAQNQLSASQKRQYQPIIYSSDHDAEGQGKARLTKSAAYQIEQRSSDDATIAYTTPSGFGSSDAPPLSAVQAPVEMVSSMSVSLSVKKRMVIEGGDEPNSSPDILTGSSPYHDRARQVQEFALQRAISEDVNLPSVGNKRKKKQPNLVQGLPRDPEDAELLMERYVPRPSRRRSAAATLPNTQLQEETYESTEVVEKQDDEPILISSGQASIDPAAVPEPPMPKKRGRKKKLPQSGEGLERDVETSGVGSQALTMDTPAPLKRKRGRPKKGEKPVVSPEVDYSVASNNPTITENVDNLGDKKENIADPPGIEDASIEAPTTPMQDTLQDDQPRQRGRGRKRPGEANATLDSPEPRTPREKEILKDISNIATNSEAPPSRDEGSENLAVLAPGKKEMIEPEPSEKDTFSQSTKMAVSNSQLSKVTYRVGLSKRSRIAPLLKSLRK